MLPISISKSVAESTDEMIVELFLDLYLNHTCFLFYHSS